METFRVDNIESWTFFKTFSRSCESCDDSGNSCRHYSNWGHSRRLLDVMAHHSSSWRVWTIPPALTPRGVEFLLVFLIPLPRCATAINFLSSRQLILLRELHTHQPNKRQWFLFYSQNTNDKTNCCSCWMINNEQLFISEWQTRAVNPRFNLSSPQTLKLLRMFDKVLGKILSFIFRRRFDILELIQRNNSALELGERHRKGSKFCYSLLLLLSRTLSRHLNSQKGGSRRIAKHSALSRVERIFVNISRLLEHKTSWLKRAAIELHCLRMKFSLFGPWTKRSSSHTRQTRWRR